MMEKSKNETLLWDLRELEDNNKCADCTDSFPRFLNTSLGTFVCSVCGAVHREIGHRVKSLASDKFNDEEIEKLKNIGNKKAHDIWLSKWSEKEYPTPLPSEEKKVREFIKMKYVEKKWASLDQLTPSKLSSPVNKNSTTVPPSPANIEGVTSPIPKQQVTSPYERKSNVDSRKLISKEFENLSISLDSANTSTASISSLYENGNASKYAPLPPKSTGNTSSIDGNGKPFNPFREENKYFTEKKETFPPFSKEPFDQHSYLKDKSTFYSKVKLEQPKQRTPPTHAQSTNITNNLNYSKPSLPTTNNQQMNQLLLTSSLPSIPNNNTFNPFVDQPLNQQPTPSNSFVQQPMQNGMYGSQNNLLHNSMQQPQQSGMLALPAPQSQQSQSLFDDLIPNSYQQTNNMMQQPQYQQNSMMQQQQPQNQLALTSSGYQQTNNMMHQQPNNMMQQSYQQNNMMQPNNMMQQSYQQPNNMMQQPNNMMQPNQESLPLDELFGLTSINPEPVFPSGDISFENGNQLDYDEDQNRAWRSAEDRKRQYLKDHEMAMKLQKELNGRPQTPPVSNDSSVTRQRSKTEPPPPLRSSGTTGNSGLRSSQSGSQRNRSRSSSMESQSASNNKHAGTHPLHSSNYQTDSYDYRAHEIVASSRYNNKYDDEEHYLESAPSAGYNVQSPRHSTNQVVVYGSNNDNSHTVECNLCGTKTSFDTMTQHKNVECLFRPMKCTYCNKLIKYIQYTDHQDLCQTKLFTCGVCGRSVPGRDMPYHLSTFHNR